MALHQFRIVVKADAMFAFSRGFRGALLINLFAWIFATNVSAAEPPHVWPPNQFAPVALERISKLKTDEQPAWKVYWDASQKLASKLPTKTAADFSPLQPIPGPPKGGLHTVGLRLDAPREWYASEEARTIADRVVAWQSKAGGWQKGIRYTEPPAKDRQKIDVYTNGTFDNDATIFELRFLARVNEAVGDTVRSRAWREAFLRGLQYVFAAQYPNGGFPQIYPLVGGYHDAITFNDQAMTHALELLRDIAAKKPEFAFIPAELRQEAGPRLERGVRCLLATQLKTSDGRRTIWCQQYDALTLQACAARNFEPIAACASESAYLTKFLMTIPHPSPELVKAVDSAMAWFRRTPVHDIKWSRSDNDARPKTAPGAPPLWARFYELNTDKPIFGDRDRTIHYAVAELSPERRAGYSWYGDWPASALETFNTWRQK